MQGEILRVSHAETRPVGTELCWPAMRSSLFYKSYISDDCPSFAKATEGILHSASEEWCTRQDLNLRPPAPQAGALSS